MSKLSKQGKIDYKNWQSEWLHKTKVIKKLKLLKLRKGLNNLNEAVEGLIYIYEKEHGEIK